MEIIFIFLIGISLSMDAFSLAICYGTMNLTKRHIIELSTIVGIYHFIMPQIGMTVGHLIENFVVLNMKYVVFGIFLLIGLDMLVSAIRKKKPTILLNTLGMLLFGFTVSIDSFSAGIGMEMISNKHILCSVIFSLTSFSFTYVGLKLGGKISDKLSDFSQIFGAILLIAFAFSYLLK